MKKILKKECDINLETLPEKRRKEYFNDYGYNIENSQRKSHFKDYAYTNQNNIIKVKK